MPSKKLHITPSIVNGHGVPQSTMKAFAYGTSAQMSML